MPARTSEILALGVTQTIAWASSIYLPAVLALPMASELGLPPATVFAAFSASLAVMALLGPAVGRVIDRRGGREVLCVSNLVLAAGLLLLGSAASGAALFLAWVVIGAGMALGLYDAAFASLVRLHGLEARGAITGITLLGGFASTVGWPLTSFLASAWDWRFACLVWAALHGLLALPINFRFIPSPTAGTGHGGPDKAPTPLPEASGGRSERRRTFALLALFGAATSFVTSAMAAHLPGLFAAAGVGAAAAVAAAALVGPAQVIARLAEFGLAHRFHLHPLVTARLATALHPAAGLGLLLAGGGPAMAAAFALLHGAGNGLITIAKGTLPLALFGAAGYGARVGLLAVAQRGMQAIAPFAFSLVLERLGAPAAIALTAILSCIGLLALLLIRLDRESNP